MWSVRRHEAIFILCWSPPRGGKNVCPNLQFPRTVSVPSPDMGWGAVNMDGARAGGSLEHVSTSLIMMSLADELAKTNDAFFHPKRLQLQVVLTEGVREISFPSIRTGYSYLTTVTVAGCQ